MLFKLIKAERLKLKRSPLWLAFLFMPVIPALLGTLNYMANIEILQSEWFSLWTQHTLFTCYFFFADHDRDLFLLHYAAGGKQP